MPIADFAGVESPLFLNRQSAFGNGQCYYVGLSRDEANIRGEAMMVLKKAAVFFLLIGATLLFSACPSQTNISKINRNPDRYRNKEVGIAGRVTDSYGALGVGAYEIDDGTGRIWVATR